MNKGNNQKMLEIGFLGLGRMGLGMVSRMLESKKVKVHVWNRSPEPRVEAEKMGAVAYENISKLIDGMKSSPRIVWLMLPSGEVTENTFMEVLGLLSKGDILIDGANSYVVDTLRRHKLCEEKGVQMLDVGVSGGTLPQTKKMGYPMMIGGEERAYKCVEPILSCFGREGSFGLMGPAGSGHYVKMVHNAIEYGMMQSIAEGFDLLENGRFKGKLDLKNIAKTIEKGTIVEGLLFTMAKQAIEKDAKLSELEPYVDDNGEGRWAVKEAIDTAVPFDVNARAVFARFSSRDKNSYAMRLLSAIRNEFGSHKLHKK